MMREMIEALEGGRIAALYAQGATPSEISAAILDELGIVRSAQTISNYLRRSGLRQAHDSRRERIKARLRQLFVQNLSSKEAARVLHQEFGHLIHGNSVCKAWRDMGLRREMRPVSVPGRGHLAIPANAHPLVRRFYRALNHQRTTIGEVEARAGLGDGTVGRWARTNGPLLSNFVAACNVLDLEVIVRERHPE
ncbi:hypothetical protein ACLBXM_17860 [Xanthobacteraceae bacterium A53D]